MDLSFKTRKLKNSVVKIANRAKNLNLQIDSLSVYGVSKEEGVVVTGKEIGSNLTEYFYFEGQKFAYNPYRINIGSIGLTTEDFKGLMSPAYVIFEVDETIYPEFLLLYLKSNLGQTLIRWYGDRGGVRSSLRILDLGEIDFPDISYEQQSRFCQEYFVKKSKIDEFLDELNKEDKFNTELQKSILMDAIQGKLSEKWRDQHQTTESAKKLLSRIKHEKDKSITKGILKRGKLQESLNTDDSNIKYPNSWDYVTLDDITQFITDGTHQTPTYVQSGKIFLSAQNIKPFKFMPENHKFISQEAYDSYTMNRKTEKGDILICRVGAGIGEAAVIDQDLEFAIYVSLGLIKTFKQYTSPYYLAIVLNSSYGVNYAKANTSSKNSSAGNFNLGRIRNLKIPLPPLEEQYYIANKVYKTLAYCENLDIEIKLKRKNAENLLQASLSEFLGQVNPIELPPREDEHKKERLTKYNSKTTFMELVDLLKEHGKLYAEDLWKMSKYFDNKDIGDSIDKFYADLKKKIEVDKTIKEVENEKGYLELV